MSEKAQEVLSPLGIEGGPTQEQIDNWKSKFGDIYVATFNPTEKYIYRPLKRFEYKQILQTGQAPENRTFSEEKIVEKCIIWPRIEPTSLSTMKAGTISTLVDLIMASSNFGITEEPVKL